MSIGKRPEWAATCPCSSCPARSSFVATCPSAEPCANRPARYASNRQRDGTAVAGTCGVALLVSRSHVMDRFGGLDVVVNNAGYGFLGAGHRIRGATRSHLRLRAAQVGKRITVRMTPLPLRDTRRCARRHHGQRPYAVGEHDRRRTGGAAAYPPRGCRGRWGRRGPRDQPSRETSIRHRSPPSACPHASLGRRCHGLGSSGRLMIRRSLSREGLATRMT